MKRPRLAVIAIMLIISITNYSRIPGTENIRAIEFLSIFVIGALSALLIVSAVLFFKARKSNEEK